MTPDHEIDPLDQATSERLAKLRTMPVDTSRLDARLRAEIPHPAHGRARGRWRWPLRAIAAMLIVAITLAVILIASAGTPVYASAAEMARWHEDLVANRVPVTQVDSIEEASAVLQAPDLPAPPDAHVMACCMKSVKNKKVACVLLRTDSTPITMTVAAASDFRPPNCPTVTRDGRTYCVQAVGDLNMVMTERNGRWVCLIAQMPSERLMALADRLQF